MGSLDRCGVSATLCKTQRRVRHKKISGCAIKEPASLGRIRRSGRREIAKARGRHDDGIVGRQNRQPAAKFAQTRTRRASGCEQQVFVTRVEGLGWRLDAAAEDGNLRASRRGQELRAEDPAQHEPDGGSHEAIVSPKKRLVSHALEQRARLGRGNNSHQGSCVRNPDRVAHGLQGPGAGICRAGAQRTREAGTNIAIGCRCDHEPRSKRLGIRLGRFRCESQGQRGIPFE
jgi:hypothetical protein